MRRLLKKLDSSAAESVARGEFTSREVLLVCGVVLLLCAMLTFGGRVPLIFAQSDPASDRSLVYFLQMVMLVFWVSAGGLCYWASRWFAHHRARIRGADCTNALFSPAELTATQQPTVDIHALPLSWPPDKILAPRDFLAMGTFLAFFLIPGLLVIELFVRLIPSTRQQPTYTSLLALAAAIVVVGVAAKYTWLIVMSRWLRKSEVAPIIAYGIPRRLARLDQQLLEHYYTT